MLMNAYGIVVMPIGQLGHKTKQPTHIQQTNLCRTSKLGDKHMAIK